MIKLDNDAQWSLNLFNSLNEGGVWGVPRSGLLFRRERSRLVLVARMPHVEHMPISERELVEFQDADFEVIRKVFGRAGVTVCESHNKEVRS